MIPAKRSAFLRDGLAFSVLVLLFAVWDGTTWAQVDQGAITGAVQDNTGAAIPGASVALTSTDNGLVLAAKTDASGVYTFSPVRIGNYKLTATAPGFQATTQENVHLDLQQTLNVVLKLKPGAITQTVIVNTAPPLLQTQEGSVGQVLSTDTVNNTPLNGRNWVYIAQLTAGVDPSFGTRGNGNGDFAANGQTAIQNNFVLDGVDNNMYGVSFTNHASYALQPPPDALAEFKVQTSNYSAGLGHSAGAVVNTSIKSGTNQVHGDLWEYFRNTALDARDFDALTIPAYHENQFGATLGMPIVKNKLFFFGYSEANRIIQGQTATLTVPTALERQGNFTELLNTNLTGEAQPIHLFQAGSAGTQPLTCNAQDNVICPAQIDPVALRLLQLYPMPNTNAGKTYSNYNLNTNASYLSWQWGVRTDWNITNRDQAFARFSYLHIPQNYPAPLGPILDGGLINLEDGPSSILAENFAANETHEFSSTFSNVLGIGRVYTDNAFLQLNAGNSNLAASLGLGGIPPGQDNGGLPKVSVAGISTFGTQTFLPNDGWSNVYVIQDDATKILGNHSLKFGGEFQSVRFAALQPPESRGTYNFAAYFTSTPGKAFTGSGVADFLLNQMESALVSDGFLAIYSTWYRAGYVQDDWKVDQRLTLNLGVRYEYFEPDKEVGGYQASFNITGPIAPGSGQGIFTLPVQRQNTYLSPTFRGILSASNTSLQYSNNIYLTSAQKMNFSPRIGFAYMVDDKTVLRGGFGIFYGGLENIGGSPLLYNNYPFQYQSSFPRPGVCKPGDCATNGITLEQGFTQQLAGGVQNLGNYVSRPAFQGVPAHLNTPYTASYNLSVERSLTPTLVATMGYVGDVDRHLPDSINQNSADALTDPRLNSILAEPFPGLGSVALNEREGMSDYNALQTKLEKRYGNGLSFLASYTWSHAMDDTAPPLGGGSGYRNPNLIGIRNDYTNSGYDVRQRVTMNGYYDLPFGSGRSYLNRAGVANFIAGGWAADLVFVAQTGEPISVGTDLGSAGPNGATAYATQIRDPFAPGGSPDPSNPGIACAQRTRTLQHWYNPCAFANPPLAFPQAAVAGSPISHTQITGLAALPYLGARPASVPGPGYEGINLSLFKNLPTFREQYLQFRADIFNVLNTPDYGTPSTSNDSTAGGLITSARFFQNFTPDSRFFQLSLKYVF